MVPWRLLTILGVLLMSYDFGPSPFAALRSRTLAPNPSGRISMPEGFSFTGQKAPTAMRPRQRGGSTLQPFSFDLGDVAQTIGGATQLGRDFGTPGATTQAGAEAQGAPAGGITVATDRPQGLLRAPIGTAPRAIRPPQPPAAQPSPEAPPGPEGPSELEQVFARTQQIVSAAKGAGKLVQELAAPAPPSHALAPGTAEAVTMQREGERQDLSAAMAAPALNAARLGIGAAPFTHEFTDPRFPGMVFPSTGPITGVETTPLAPDLPVSFPGGEGARFETGSPAPSAAAPTVSPLPGGGSPGTPAVTPSGIGDAFMQGTGAGFGLADIAKAGGQAFNVAGGLTSVGSGALDISEGRTLPGALKIGQGALSLGATGALPGVPNFPAGVGAALPFVGAAINIAGNITSNAPDWQKGANSAVDVAAAALAPSTLGLSLVAAPLIKQDMGKTVGTLSNWNDASTGAKFAAVNPDPVFRITNAILGMLGVDLFGGQSQAWQSFPGRVADTLRLEQQAGQNLATGLRQASSKTDVAQAIRTFKTTLANQIGGFGAGTGPYDIPDLPGAGGSKHEGGIKADFSPQVGVLRTLTSRILTNFQGQPDVTGDLAQPFALPRGEELAAVAPQLVPQPGGKGLASAPQPGFKGGGGGGSQPGRK